MNPAAAIDFADMLAGIDALDEHRHDPRARARIAARLLDDIKELPPKWSGVAEFIDAVHIVLQTGGPLDRVRDAFTRMVVASGGWSLSQVGAKARRKGQRMAVERRRLALTGLQRNVLAMEKQLGGRATNRQIVDALAARGDHERSISNVATVRRRLRSKGL